MSEIPAISIVMPVRDAAETLEPTLDSIRRQTFTDWELLVVNDGSTDKTANILNSAERVDPRIRVFSQSAAGIAEALRTGSAAARGEFIARMDADDYMHPERLQQQFAFLQCNPQIGLVSCRVRHGGDESTQAGYASHVSWLNSLLTPAQMSLRRFVESPVAHPSVMFRRELLHRHGGYRAGDFPEDYELWLRWMDAGVQFGKVDAELLTWNDLPDRLSRVDVRYRVEAFYRVKCIYLARCLKREVDPSREIWLWGAGRITRQRFRSLETEGVSIAGFIDVDPAKIGSLRDGRPVIGLQDLSSGDQRFILSAVSARGARDSITEALNCRGYQEGNDYLLVG